MSNEIEIKNDFGKEAVDHTSLLTLLALMTENNARKLFTPYVGFEISETRRKYHLLNQVMSNSQRSGLYLIDVEDHTVYQSVGYGKTNGRRVGTVASLIRNYTDANLANATGPHIYRTDNCTKKAKKVPSNTETKAETKALEVIKTWNMECAERRVPILSCDHTVCGRLLLQLLTRVFEESGV